MSWLQFKHKKQLFLALGLGLLAFFIYRADPLQLWQYLKKAGWGFFWILLNSFGWMLIYTYAWQRVLKSFGAQINFKDLLKIKILGEGTNSLTPLGWGGGDPFRIYLIKKHLPLSQGTASVLTDRLLHSLAVLIFTLIGILLGVQILEIPDTWKFFLSLLFIFFLGLGAYLLIQTQKGLFKFLLLWAKRLGLGRFIKEDGAQKLLAYDQNIQKFCHRGSSELWMGLGLHSMGRILGIVEILLAAWLIGEHLTFLQAYLLASMSVVLNMLFTFIPGSLGVMEGAYAGAFSLMGFSAAAGTAVQILRRLRIFFWILVGLVLFKTQNKISKRP